MSPSINRETTAAAEITVAEALALPALSRGEALAGLTGLDRRIRAVNVLEDADIVRWMRGGELLLTTGYSVREEPGRLAELIPALAARGVAGLVLKVGLYVEVLPPEAAVAADRLGFPVLGLPAEVMFRDILTEIFDTVLARHATELERSNAIHARLTEVALSGGSFRELAAAVSELVAAPVLIRDAHARVLAATRDVPEELDAPHLVRPIRSGGSEAGVVVVYKRPDAVRAHELKTMEHAATVAATAIAQERAVESSEQRHRTLLLMQLVSRRPIDREEISRWAPTFGWDLDAAHAVVLVELNDPAGPVLVAGQPIEAKLTRTARDALPPGSIVWGLRSGLAVLAEPGSSLAAVCASLHGALGRVSRGLRVMVAAGRVASEVGELHRSYEEAASTLSLGRELRGNDFVLEHDDLGVYRLLSQLSTDDLREHRRRAIGPLLDYDAEHNGSLVQTLEAFLRCDSNRVRAAEELFVHYNTLRYRLAQIEQLTGGLTADRTQRLNLELALAAHRLLLARRAG